MTVETSESVDLAAQRAELKTVLESKEFARAPTLAHLLSYLCERLFAGESNQIKEYSVGVEVFHRGASFDQDSDSIVRVEANRLRKRLAEYYAGPGAPHVLNISIPVGQYVPRFEREKDRMAAGLAEVSSGGMTEDAGAGGRASGRWFARVDVRFWWIAVGLAILLIGLGAGWLLLREQKQPSPAAVAVPASSQFTDSEFGPPAGEEVRILAGEGRSFVDHAGKLWSADTWFEGGTVIKSAEQHIWRTQNPSFYRTGRQGQFRYKIPLKKGIYELRLHFAETIYDPDSNGTGGEGSRIFTVRANGKTLLSRFDIVTDAGGSRTADVKVFPDISPAADGFLYLDFAGEDGSQAILSALEILPGVRGHIRPVRVLARQTPYYSNDSHWWSPDNYFEGGQLASYTAPVSGTDDPELFETERWGNFSYAIPVSPGRYAILLYFAVRQGAWDQPSPASGDDSAKVAHTFNVFCNGTVLLKNFNLAQEASHADVVIRRFAGLQPNAQGKLMLNFVPVDGYATVTGIEVLPQ